MNEKVIMQLQEVIISQKFNTASEIVNAILLKHKDLSLSDLIELKKIAQVQLDCNCSLKHFV